MNKKKHPSGCYLYGLFKPPRSEEGSLRDEIPQAGFRAAALTFPGRPKSIPRYFIFSMYSSRHQLL